MTSKFPKLTTNITVKKCFKNSIKFTKEQAEF